MPVRFLERNGAGLCKPLCWPVTSSYALEHGHDATRVGAFTQDVRPQL